MTGGDLVSVLILADTGLLILLAILMVGLLRGHAELLRRTGGVQVDGPPSAADEPPVGAGSLPEPRGEETPAWDVAGRTLRGDAVKLAMRSERNTLLAFLSSGCLSCQPFWEQLDEVAGLVNSGSLEDEDKLVVEAEVDLSPTEMKTLFVVPSFAILDFHYDDDALSWIVYASRCSAAAAGTIIRLQSECTSGAL